MKRLSYALLAVLIPFQSGYAQDLLETYQLALQNDPDYKVSDINKLSTAEIKSQSIAQMLPNVSANASTLANRINNQKASYLGSGMQDYWDHSFSINLKQPIFNLGHWIQLDQSDNKIAQAEADFQAKQQALIRKTSEAYFNILAAQDNLEFTIAERKAIEKELEQAKQRFEVGMIAITDVYEAQAGYDSALASEIEALNKVDNSKEALREILGNNLAELNKLQKNIPLNKPVPENLDEWTDSAQGNNFSVISQLNQAEFIRKTISLQQSKHLPTVDLIAKYYIQDNGNKFGFRGDNENIGLQLNLPLFESGATASRVRQAEYDYEAAKQELIKVKRSITRNVKDAFRGVVSNVSRIKALDATAQSAEKAVEAAEAGFEVGTRTMVDVLTEQRSLFKARSDYARSRYDYLINGIKLKEAAGSLSEADLQQINQYLERL